MGGLTPAQFLPFRRAVLVESSARVKAPVRLAQSRELSDIRQGNTIVTLLA